MSVRPIGYYVHHHGAGHRARANAIASACDWPIVQLGTGIGSAGIDLEDDRLRSGLFDGADTAQYRPEALHYAPIDHDGIRSRVARIAAWIAEVRPLLMVVDVSVEMAMLARLASVPTIYVRLMGDRTDPAHLEAFRGASALLAPFPAQFESLSTPEWVLKKTFYAPSIGAAAVPDEAAAKQSVLIVHGCGGAPIDGGLITRIALACPQWEWRVVGPVAPREGKASNLKLQGWIDEPEREIARASIVVGAAGDGLVCSMMATRKPFICIPEDRPFGEQAATAKRLEDLGAAVVLPSWPEPRAWPALLEVAMQMPMAERTGLHDSASARKVASWLTSQAMAAGSCHERAA